MTKKIILTAMAVFSVANVLNTESPKLYYNTVPEKILKQIKDAQNATKPSLLAGIVAKNPGTVLVTGLTAYSASVASAMKAYANYMTPVEQLTRWEKVKNAATDAKNYVVNSKLGQLVANHPKKAIAAVSATVLAGIGAYVAKSFGSSTDVKEVKTVKETPKAQPTKTAPKRLTPAQMAAKRKAALRK